MKKGTLCGLVAVLALCFAGCGKDEALPEIVVSSNTAVSSQDVVVSVSNDAGADESGAAVSDNGEEYVPLEIGGEEMTGQEEESDASDAQAVIEAKGEADYDTSAMLEGTRVGISGTEEEPVVWASVDGRGLLYDFSGYGLPYVNRIEGAVTGMQGFNGPYTYWFYAYYGGLSDKSVGKSLGERAVGDMECEAFWDEDEYGYYYTLYCAAVDVGVEVAVMKEDGMDGDAVLSEIEATVEDDLKSFAVPAE